MKIKQRTKISLVIILIIMVGWIHFYGEWIPVLFWHITHKNPIEYHNMKIKVPFSWIAFEVKEKDSINIIHKDKKVSTYITKDVTPLLDKDEVSEKDIELIKERLKKMDARFIKYGQIKVANKTGNFIDYIKRSELNRVINFPTECIEVTISSDADTFQSNDLIILNNISFEDK